MGHRPVFEAVETANSICLLESDVQNRVPSELKEEEDATTRRYRYGYRTTGISSQGRVQYEYGEAFMQMKGGGRRDSVSIAPSHNRRNVTGNTMTTQR